MLREERRDEPKLLLSWQSSNPTRDIFLVPKIPAGMFLNSFASSRTRYSRQENEFFRSLPRMVSYSFIDIARTKLMYPLALEGLAGSVGKCHFDVRAFLGVALATDGVHEGMRIEVFQKRLAKPLEAFWIKTIDGERLVKRNDRRLGGISSRGKELSGSGS